MTTAALSHAVLPDNELRRIVCFGFAILAFLLAGLTLWSTLAPLHGAVIGAGVVKVDMNRKTLQHSEGGIVREVQVRDGDAVKSGQPLLVLGDVRVEANRALLMAQLDAERVKAARLDAERRDARDFVLPSAFGSRRQETELQALISREEALFATRREALETQIRLLRRQATQVQAEAEARTRQLGFDSESQQATEEEYRLNRKLQEQGFVSKARLLNLTRNMSDYKGRLAENEAELARVRQRTSELEIRIAGIRDDFMRKAAEEHRQTEAQIVDLEQRLRPLEDQTERMVVRAPMDGVVVGLKFTNPGMVVGPRDALLDLVPRQTDLIVEARIRPDDINHVQVGSSAEVRLPAFQQRVTPMIAGVVTHVSADRFEDKATLQPYYVVQTRVSNQDLQQAGIDHLQPGMSAEVYVQTQSRTVLEYLVAPVTGYLRKGMREF